jgi:hypothetical protein
LLSLGFPFYCKLKTHPPSAEGVVGPVLGGVQKSF